MTIRKYTYQTVFALLFTQGIAFSAWLDGLPAEKRQLLCDHSAEAIVYFMRFFDPADSNGIDVAAMRKRQSAGAWADLPIGVFDSGTGGLAVLEELRKTLPQNESCIFYADQANMPWGEYPTTAKRTDTLKEIMMSIYKWLLTDRYHISSRMQTGPRKPVKAIVVACNTATAYSVALAREVLTLGHLILALPEIPVYGIIDAGAEGALAHLAQHSIKNATIAVMATSGTVDSGAYPDAIQRLRKEQELDSVAVYQQAGIGLAGAIDQMNEYIDIEASGFRDAYQGPNAARFPQMIDRNLWDRCNFSCGPHGHAMLVKKNGPVIEDFQLNSVENYIRFSVVLLLEKMLQAGETRPLRVVVLGCTHYPYYLGTFVQVFREMRRLQVNGQYPYRSIISQDLIFIDPAANLAQTVARGLQQRHLLKNPAAPDQLDQFFISTPRAGLSADVFVHQDARLGFAASYKHGREVRDGKRIRPETVDDIARVPMGRSVVDEAVAKRLAKRVPHTFNAMTLFSRQFFNSKSDSTFRPF
jgi:glutamate racemase